MTTAIRFAIVLVVAALTAPALFAQGGNPLPPSAPGNPPDVPYLEEHWELLWYLNQDVLLPQIARLDALDDDDRKQAIDALRPAASATDGAERAAALMAMAKTGDASVLPLLVAGADDANLDARRSALLALGVLGDAGAVESLARTLDAKNLEGDLRFCAAVALGLLRNESVERGGASPARAVFETWLAPKAFAAADPRLQQGIAFGAGLSGDLQLAEPLARSLKTKASKKNSVVRAFLVLGLGKLRDRAHVDALYKALSDDDINVRRSAILAVGSVYSGTGDGEATRRLVKLESKESDAVATNFANLALGFVGGADAQRALAIRLLGERTSGIDPSTLLPRISFGTRSRQPITGLALGAARGAAYRKAFERLFKDEADVRAKSAYAIGLGLLGHPDSAMPLLAEFKASSDPRYRTYLALALGLVKSPDALPLLLPIVAQSSDDELVPACAVAVALIDPHAAQGALLARLATETSAPARQIVLYGLGLVGDRAALAPILAVLQDREHEQTQVRAYAAIALGCLVDVDRPRRLADVNALFNFTLDPSLFRTLLSTP